MTSGRDQQLNHLAKGGMVGASVGGGGKRWMSKDWQQQKKGEK